MEERDNKQKYGSERGFRWTVRIGGPVRGDILTLEGRCFTNSSAVQTAFECLELFSRELGLEGDYLKDIVKKRVGMMK